MEYLEFSFNINPLSPGRDILVAALAGIEFESFVEIENGLTAYIPGSKFDPELFKELSVFKNKDFEINWSSKTIPPQNWNAIWESSFEPILIGNDCCIRAPFHPSVSGVKYDVIIEPKMSFGTGHHPTTFLMAQKILKLNIQGTSLLDMGCGTGVLAILAYKMGARPVTAIDNDELAVNNTRENILVNSCSIDVYKGESNLLQDKTFHTILANINRNVLKKDISIYSKSLEKSGNLIMSGFFDSDVPEITSEAIKNGLKLEDRQSQNTWSLLHFVK